MIHSTDLMHELLKKHHDTKTVDSVVTYPPKTEEASLYWKYTGVCPACSHRAITGGRCLNCAWMQRKETPIELPETVSDWQLYDMKGAKRAARSLTAGLKRCEKELRNRGIKGDVSATLWKLFVKHLELAMMRNSYVGACDTEPVGVAKRYLNWVLNDMGIEGYFDAF